MMRRFIRLILVGVMGMIALGIMGCSEKKSDSPTTGALTMPDYTMEISGTFARFDSGTVMLLSDEQPLSFTSISMSEAKAIFEQGGDYIILDVRRADEFADGHIPGAINVANESIADTCPAELPDKDQLIYVYCRSGNRSKQAAKKLVEMGYTNIVEFGGILDWTGDIEK